MLQTRTYASLAQSSAGFRIELSESDANEKLRAVRIQLDNELEALRLVMREVMNKVSGSSTITRSNEIEKIYAIARYIGRSIKNEVHGRDLPSLEARVQQTKQSAEDVKKSLDSCSRSICQLRVDSVRSEMAAWESIRQITHSSTSVPEDIMAQIKDVGTIREWAVDNTDLLSQPLQRMKVVRDEVLRVEKEFNEVLIRKTKGFWAARRYADAKRDYERITMFTDVDPVLNTRLEPHYLRKRNRQLADACLEEAIFAIPNKYRTSPLLHTKVPM